MTDTTHSPETAPTDAVIVAVPMATALIFPSSTVATDESLVDHAIVISLASAGEMVTFNMISLPTYIETDVLSNAMLSTATGAFTSNCADELNVPHSRVTVCVPTDILGIYIVWTISDLESGADLFPSSIR